MRGDARAGNRRRLHRRRHDHHADQEPVVENKEVDAASIKVETLNGNVMLSGFAKNNTERASAEAIARKVSGVKSVRNEVAVRP